MPPPHLVLACLYPSQNNYPARSPPRLSRLYTPRLTQTTDRMRLLLKHTAIRDPRLESHTLYYIYHCTLHSVQVHALRDPNWQKAMLDEYNTLITNDTWVLVPRPANVNIVRSMWLFKHKYHADGSLTHYKARLVTNGRSQQHGIDCDETFSLRVIASLHAEFAMTNLGSLNYFLGIFVRRSSSCLFLSQTTYAEEILERAHMQKCNPCKTRVDTESKLGANGDPVSDLTLYQSLAGALYVFYAMLPVTRRSTSGYCVFLGDDLLSWFAKRQVTLSCSSVEAEYRGVANVVAETAWVRNLLLELHAPLFSATLVYGNNVSAVYLSTNPVQHLRTKHIEIDIHFVRDFVDSGQVRVLHVPSRFQYADIFTKGLPNALFLEFRSSLNVRRPPAQTTGVY
ncbi:ribonuclease H-like domain-containing protein [Tanacetum coccineum]